MSRSETSASARPDRSRPHHPSAPLSPENTNDREQPAEEYLHQTLPSRQESAREFLQGEVPGVQQSYAPDARPSPTEGWVEDDETVERLARWRREAPYG